jgi:excisionase family DNA binding protein
MPETNPKLAFTIREACAASTLGKTTLYAHINAGRLKAVRLGGRTIIPADSLRLLISGGVE